MKQFNSRLRCFPKESIQDMTQAASENNDSNHLMTQGENHSIRINSWINCESYSSLHGSSLVSPLSEAFRRIHGWNHCQCNELAKTYFLYSWGLSRYQQKHVILPQGNRNSFPLHAWALPQKFECGGQRREMRRTREPVRGLGGPAQYSTIVLC